MLLSPDSSAAVPVPDAVTAVPVTQKPRLHLPYLDGIRALMALYVVNHHLLTQLFSPGERHSERAQWSWREVIEVFHHGHYAVAVFIVLSGYCLMLPVLREGESPRGGIFDFFKRRARRILPPYYAALLASAALLVVARMHPIAWPKGSWALHLTLLHNLSPAFIHDFNGALWSVATEWQIYFLFPLLLLPVWKRAGDWALLIVSLALSAALFVAFPAQAQACPWFIALFASGMLAAKYSLISGGNRVSWAWIGTGLALATYIGVRFVPEFSWFSVNTAPSRLGIYPLSDISFGVATCCFLIHGTRASLAGRDSRMVALLTKRPVLWVGAFSYSLYLVHLPLLLVALKLLQRFGLPRPLLHAAMMFVAFPLIIACAFGFSLAFEKPFLRARTKTTA